MVLVVVLWIVSIGSLVAGMVAYWAGHYAPYFDVALVSAILSVAATIARKKKGESWLEGEKRRLGSEDKKGCVPPTSGGL